MSNTKSSRERIVAGAIPEPPPQTFSHALRAGDTIYVSGQHAGEPDGTILGEGSVLEQSRRAFAKIAALLEAAGATMDDVVKLTVYLTDIAKRAELSAARREFFRGDFPCSTLVEISALAQPGLLVEIDAIAHVRSMSSPT
jgi:enamine deaminase RidA (YjgF/YER057c/UK114 family)